MWLQEVWTKSIDQLGEFAPQIVVGLIVFVLFWIGSIAAKNIIGRVGAMRKIDPGLVGFLGRAAKTGLILFGAVTSLGTMGMNVTALVAGLGLTGFAVGFALKDVISNALAGILIIIYKPFKQKDHITVSSFTGQVNSIDLRYTVLEAQGKKIFIPNSMLFSNAVSVTHSEPSEESVS